MLIMTNFNIFLFIFIIFLRIGYCEYTYSRMYESIPYTNYAECVRKLNATHQIGCSSKLGGNSGTLHYIEDSSDVDWLIESGEHAPYVVLLRPNYFTSYFVTRLRNSGKITGIMVIHVNETETERPDKFSPDNSCPNEQFSLYKNDPDFNNCKEVTWNPYGNGWLFQDIDIPIIALTNSSDVNFFINKCYKPFNSLENKTRVTYPLCHVELKTEMNGAVNAETCLRRTDLMFNVLFENDELCASLYNYNVYSLVRPTNMSLPLNDKSIIMASARMDALSLFEGLDTGATIPVTGMVALLAAAEAIGKVKHEIEDSDNNIMFVFFHAESFDYLGSTRMVYELEKKYFPYEVKSADELPEQGAAHIELKHIQSFLEMSQMGFTKDETVWLHTDPNIMTSENLELKKMIMERAEGVDLAMNSAPEGQPLPPASLQSFLRKIDIPGLLVADHQTNYSYNYYNSRFDNVSRLNLDYPEEANMTEQYNHVGPLAVQLQKVATVVAQTLYLKANNNITDVSHVQADNVTVANLLYCFLINPQCDLFYTTALADKNIDNIGRNFLSVEQSSALANTIRRILAYFLGDIVPIDQEDCNSNDQDTTYYYYFWAQGLTNSSSDNRTGMCMRHLAGLTKAESPAFDIDDYDYASNEYPVWAESSRGAFQVRAYLVPKREREIAILCGGLGLFLVSLCGAFALSKRGNLLFE